MDEGVINVDRYHRRAPMHRFGEPDEIARAVAYLADDEQSSSSPARRCASTAAGRPPAWIV